MTGMFKWVPVLVRYLRSRAFAAAALTAAVALTVYLSAAHTKVVHIQEGREVQTFYTMNSDPREILQKCGYDTGVHDEIQFTGFCGKVAEIQITRAYPVTVMVGDDPTVLMVTGGTVSQLLERAGVELGELDQVDKPLREPVEEGDIINVTRREVLTRYRQVELPYASKTVASPQVLPGETEVVSSGRKGIRLDAFAQLLVNGVRREEYSLAQDIVQEPVDRVERTGFPSRPVSQLDFAVPFANGEPAQYKAVYRGQKAAGYSAPAGSKTASGMPAVVGHVAVNPNLIPYGSKLYIQSADGSFVYGYAVAADTGTALTQGIIGVDLFYDTYAESAANGIKYVDIYVLE